MFIYSLLFLTNALNADECDVILLNPGKIRHLSSLVHLFLRHHIFCFSLSEHGQQHLNFALLVPRKQTNTESTYALA